MKQLKTWIMREGGIYGAILQGDGFYISWNPMAMSLHSRIGETALVKQFKNGKTRYYILDGDWRNEFEAAFDGGYTACRNVFKNNINHRGSWSD